MARLIGAAVSLALALGAGSAGAQTTFVIRDVRLFDGIRISTGRTVLVKDGLIAAIGGSELSIPAGAAVVDGRNRTLLPGLIDAHVHLSNDAAADLRQAISLGVTTVLDMFTGGARFDTIKAIRARDPPDLASVRTAGIGASAPGGHPSQMGGGPIPPVRDSSEARAFVAARLAEGSDYLKIVYDDLAGLGRTLPMLDRPTLAALVAAAHERGKLAVVHVQSERQARDAIEVGADGLAHFFAAESVGSDFVRLAARHHVFVVPTLTILYGLCGKPDGSAILADTLLGPYIRPPLRRMMAVSLGDPKRPRSCAGSDRALMELDRAGVPIVTGTDAPVPGQTYGASLHGELALLVGIGLPPARALTAATAAAARAFRLDDRGRIAVGRRADLLLVDGDPTRDIMATRRIIGVWKRGAPVDRLRYDP
jgi:imidazolonepropionase-like amidohydrolase